MPENETITTWKIILSPFAIVAIVLLPLLETTLEIELYESNLPIHWRFFISACIGGCLGAIVEILRKVFNADKQKETERANALEHQIAQLRLNHSIIERDIFINSYKLNEEWVKVNQEIADREAELPDKF